MSTSFDPKKLEQLNSVSSCFCLAKWLQVTIDLVNGTTHSCHHPKRHKVPLDELAQDPGALHNTFYKKEQRKMMLDGKRPSECSYCWDMEDLGQKYSDRYIKSTDPWAWSELKRIAQMPWDQNVKPRYVEVMLDSTCNFSCAYCMADISTGVAAEMQKYGPYAGFSTHHRLGQAQVSRSHRTPYVEAFEKWLPTIISDLHVLRLTGGEPLLSPTFWKLLETLKSTKNQKLELAVNSHFKHTPSVIEKFCHQISLLKNNDNIRSLELYVSLDTYGAQAEYIRAGLDYSLVLENLKLANQLLPDLKPVIMCTFNILSISQFDRFLDDIVDLKKINSQFVLDISYLKNPEYLRADMADSDQIQSLHRSIDKMNRLKDFFSPHEVQKMTNLVNWVQAEKKSHEVLRNRSDFFRFVSEYDRRKNKNFLQIFPEYRDFYIQCKKSAFEGLGLHA